MQRLAGLKTDTGSKSTVRRIYYRDYRVDPVLTSDVALKNLNANPTNLARSDYDPYHGIT
jgi:hypothetical protein